VNGLLELAAAIDLCRRPRIAGRSDALTPGTRDGGLGSGRQVTCDKFVGDRMSLSAGAGRDDDEPHSVALGAAQTVIQGMPNQWTPVVL